MNKTNTNLLKAEMERIKELINIIENTEIPKYNPNGKWYDNEEYFNITSKIKQSEAELKSRLTMLRKDAIILREDLKNK